MNKRDLLLEGAIVEFYREEIRKRYQLDRLRQIPEFDAISDEMLNALRDYFLDRLYPTMEVRDEMDEAFNDLGALLRSPGRLTPLIGAAITSMLRLSIHLPAVISTAIATVDALQQTRQLEQELMAVADDIRPELEDVIQNPKKKAKYQRTMLRLINAVPETTVRSLIDDVIRLFGSLSDVKMLSAMLSLMDRCLKVMEARSDVYTDKDRESMARGIEVLRGGHDLFAQLKPKQFPQILKGIEHVETEWYDSVRSGAKVAAQ